MDVNSLVSWHGNLAPRNRSASGSSPGWAGDPHVPATYLSRCGDAWSGGADRGNEFSLVNQGFFGQPVAFLLPVILLGGLSSGAGFQ